TEDRRRPARRPRGLLLFKAGVSRFRRPAADAKEIPLGIGFRLHAEIVPINRRLARDEHRVRGLARGRKGLLQRSIDEVVYLPPLLLRSGILFIEGVINHDEIWTEVVEVEASHRAGDTHPNDPDGIRINAVDDLRFHTGPLRALPELKGGREEAVV